MHGGEHNTVIIDAGTGQGICTGLTLEQARILVGVHNQQLAVSVVRDGHDPNTHINRCDVNILNEHADHHAFNGEVMQRIVINRVVEIVVRGNGTPQDILRKAANQLNDPGSNTTFSVRNS
jgi:ribosomal protein L11 methylase PrmA